MLTCKDINSVLLAIPTRDTALNRQPAPACTDTQHLQDAGSHVQANPYAHGTVDRALTQISFADVGGDVRAQGGCESVMRSGAS